MAQQQQQQQQEELDWKTILQESMWLTAVWEWLQKLLGRAVDLVLWVTMVFSCYQLIPGAPQPAPSVSTTMFILQFIALDVGGLSLDRLAQQQGLDRFAYSRVIAYILIGITLVTISYAGIEHAVKIDASVTNWTEALLVIARSVMTVLYGRAIQALKEADHRLRERLAELEELVPTLRHQLATEQQTVSSLRERLSCVQQQVERGQVQLSTLRGHLENKQTEVESGQSILSSLKQQVKDLTEQLTQAHREKHALLAQVNRSETQVLDLTSKVERSEKQVSYLTSKLREMTSSSAGQKEVSTHRSEQQGSTHRSEKEVTPRGGQQGNVLPFVPKQGEGRRKHDPLKVKAWCDAHPDLTQAEMAEQLGISDAANLRRLLRRARDLEGAMGQGAAGHVANNG